jgi:hypothetical protein
MTARTLALLLFSFVFTNVLQAQSTNIVKVSADSKMISKSSDKQTWAYEINLQNAGAKELGSLEVRHRIFLYSELGPKGDKKSPMTFLEDKQQVASLKVGSPLKIETKGMDFAIDEKLRIKADKDILQGIWIRVLTVDGKEIGSCIKPASLAKKMPWH